MAHDEEITLATILQHMQHLHGIVLQEIKRLDIKIDRLETKVDRLEVKVDRNHMNLTAQIDAIDKRLDAVEIEYLPKRVKALEEAVGIGR